MATSRPQLSGTGCSFAAGTAVYSAYVCVLQLLQLYVCTSIYICAAGNAVYSAYVRVLQQPFVSQHSRVCLVSILYCVCMLPALLRTRRAFACCSCCTTHMRQHTSAYVSLQLLQLLHHPFVSRHMRMSDAFTLVYACTRTHLEDRVGHALPNLKRALTEP